MLPQKIGQGIPPKIHTNIGQQGDKPVNEQTSLPVSNTPQTSQLKEIRDWAVAVIAIVSGSIVVWWGGQSIYDRNFGPQNPTDNGALKKDIDEIKKLLEEFKSQPKEKKKPS